MQLLVTKTINKSCVCYSEDLFFNPITETMSVTFICCKLPERTDCFQCSICTKCGQSRCTCGFLGIEIKVTIGRTIETVKLQERVDVKMCLLV